MKRSTGRIAALSLIALLLTLPAGLSAKEKRGATLVVTRLDGSRARGELIAVKPDSLLLLNVAGKDETIGLADMKTVKIVRRSHAGTLALVGSLTGAVAGALAFGSDPEVETAAIVLAGGLIGAAGALAGLGVSLGVGADSTFPVAGEPDETVRNFMDKLKGFSREGRIRGFPGPEEIKPAAEPRKAPAPVAAPATAPPPPSRPPHRPRFRLSLETTMSFGNGYTEPQVAPGSWRFTGEVPPEEAGPYATSFYQSRRVGMKEWAVLGPVSLAYEWTEHLLTEIELFPMGAYTGADGWAPANFVSTTDGKTYGARFDYYQGADFDSLLVGLVYRPIAPSRFERTSIEIGVAAGPARVKTFAYESLLPAEKKTVLSARVRVAYDYYFVPAFSLGAFFGYRYLEAEFPAATATGELTFRDVNDTYPYLFEPITRMTEVTFPARTITRSGLTYGLRINFRI
jgi:hypothetical protein